MPAADRLSKIAQAPGAKNGTAMRSMLIGLLITTQVCMATKAAAPNVSNYVFVEIGGKAIPLASVKHGRFEMFSVVGSAVGSEFERANGRGGFLGVKTYGYRGGQFIGPSSVIGVLASEGEGESDAVLIAAPDGSSLGAARTFTTQPLKSSVRIPPREANASEVQNALDMVRNILRSRQVPQSAWPRIIKSTRIKPVQVSTDMEILVIRTPAIEIGEKALDFFLIAERKGTEYRLKMSRLHWGGLTCKQDFDLFDHADLDSDGTDELIYSVYGWEWWRYWIIHRQNGRWEIVNRMDEQEC